MREETNPADLAAQLITLEEKLSFQQRALEELNEVVLAQASQLDRQRIELEKCRKLIEQLLDRNGGEDLPHEKPPHY